MCPYILETWQKVTESKNILPKASFMYCKTTSLCFFFEIENTLPERTRSDSVRLRCDSRYYSKPWSFCNILANNYWRYKFSLLEYSLNNNSTIFTILSCTISIIALWCYNTMKCTWEQILEPVLRMTSSVLNLWLSKGFWISANSTSPT